MFILKNANNCIFYRNNYSQWKYIYYKDNQTFVYYNLLSKESVCNQNILGRHNKVYSSILFHIVEEIIELQMVTHWYDKLLYGG